MARGRVTTVTTILYDLDGTLVDSRLDIAAAFQHAWRTVVGRMPPSAAAIARHIGKPLAEMLRELGGVLSPPLLSAFLTTYRATYAEQEAGLTLPYPEVIATLQALSAFTLGIVTTKEQGQAEMVVRRLGFTPFFHHIQGMTALLEGLQGEAREIWSPVIELGLHHEQQHQELLLTDVKYNFACNPLRPAYASPDISPPAPAVGPLQWVSFPEGVYWIGHDGQGFAFDNECPRHRCFLEPFQLASRLITNGEYLAFMADGGYARPELWLSMGWDTVQREGWKTPLYWEQRDGTWWTMTPAGMQPVQAAEPVCHVSYYEADAYARWAKARLPTEVEWEVAARPLPLRGNFVERHVFHPVPLSQVEDDGPLAQMFGDVWEWTQSHYSPYPGYTAAPGALGEYNGKFMANQFVLRGGSCATSVSHIRPTYRNFFPAEARWQFMGIRLAKTIQG